MRGEAETCPGSCHQATIDPRSGKMGLWELDAVSWS